MSNFVGINLKDFIKESGENEVKSFLSTFSCPLNHDVEHFLKYTSIEFAKQNIASTYLILASHMGKYVLVGYFTLTNKFFCIDKSSLPNSKWKHRIFKFGYFNSILNRYILSAPLIGQLGKNFSNEYNKLITGDELLKLALDKVSEMQNIVGGKIVYLECEDNKNLINFYSQNGFVNLGKRFLDNDEPDTISGDYLIQMLKYM